MRKLIYTFLSPLSYLFNKKNKNLRVLAYHTVPSAEIFSNQLAYLKATYNIISIKELEDFLYRNENLPNNSLLITFDDGDVSVFENGMKVLKTHNLPAVMFIITSLIGTKDTFWCRWVEIDYRAKGKSYLEARNKVNELKKINERERRMYLKTLAPVESRQLTLEQLNILSKGKIFIGNHTHTHPMVNRCSNEELREEFQNTKRKFNEWGLPGYPIFAYPNGNWDSRTEEILKEEGIKMGFLFDHKINSSTINPLRISRIKVNSNSDLAEFTVKVSGLHSKVLALKG